MENPILLAITGASGSLYALELLKLLRELGQPVHAVVSEAGGKVLGIELGLKPADLDGYVAARYEPDDFTAPVASGSFPLRAMVVLPCTMGTLAAIANGVAGNLIHRAADVTLKEARTLLLAPRETPLSRIHLTNMLKAQEAGALICPPMPAFYHRPQTLEEMARFFAGRLCDLLGLEVAGLPRWQGPAG